MFKQIVNTFKNTDNFIVLVIVLVMLNNIEHLAYVHHLIARHIFPTEKLNWGHSIAVVVIIELSIIVLVRRGQHGFAGVYTFMLFVLSLIYYPHDEYWKNGQYGLFVASIIYSLMFTVSIYYFAIMTAEKSYENGKLQEKNRQLDELAAELKQLRAKLQEAERALHEKINHANKFKEERDEFDGYVQQNNKVMDGLRADLKQANKELHELRLYRQQMEAACTCEHCGQHFETEASKRSHAGRCKDKPEVKEAA